MLSLSKEKMEVAVEDDVNRTGKMSSPCPTRKLCLFKEDVSSNGDVNRTGIVMEELKKQEQFREWMQVTRRSKCSQNKNMENFPKIDHLGSRFGALGEESISITEKENNGSNLPDSALNGGKVKGIP